MDKDALKIGEKLKQLRNIKGMTQTQLSMSTGFSQAHISGIESGRHHASYETLSKLAKVLNVDVSTFFEDVETLPFDHPTIYEHLNEEIKLWLARENTVPYIEFAKKLEFYGFSQDDLDILLKVLTKHKS